MIYFTFFQNIAFQLIEKLKTQVGKVCWILLGQFYSIFCGLILYYNEIFGYSVKI